MSLGKTVSNLRIVARMVGVEFEVLVHLVLHAINNVAVRVIHLMGSMRRKQFADAVRKTMLLCHTST